MASGLTYAIFSYTSSDGSKTCTVTIRAPEWENKDVTNPQQKTRRSRGGQIYVYNQGPRLRQLVLQFENLDPIEKADLEKFFGLGYVNMACRWFYITLTPNQREILKCGRKPVDDATGLAPAKIKCGQYVCGQRILMDKMVFPVRILTPEFEWIETREGRWSLGMSLEVLTGFLPANA